jgi:multidrug efflux pump subunit AcrA (membrane-fusion protein)
MNRRMTVIIALSILVVAVLIGVVFKSMKEPPAKRPKGDTRLVIPVRQVTNTDISVNVPVVGKLISTHKLEIYTEVGGVMNHSKKAFLTGERYKKGELLFSINSDEAKQSLKAKKSAFMNLLSGVIPDIKFDYPESYNEWLSYLNSIDVNKKLPKLPEAKNSREKLFFSGKNVYTTYYEIEGLEIRMAKYNIYSHFNGTLTQALIEEGTLVRAGQKVGELVKDSDYELEATISIQERLYVKVGDSVKLFSKDSVKEYTGKVTRINASIEKATQKVLVYIGVKSKDLIEGMFLSAVINSSQKLNGVEIERKSLQEGGNVFTVVNNKVKIQKVQVLYQRANSVIISGLEDGTDICLKTNDLYADREVRISRK